MYMKNIDEEIEEDWMKPSKGFRSEDTELETDAVHAGMRAFDLIINASGKEKVIPLL